MSSPVIQVGIGDAERAQKVAEAICNILSAARNNGIENKTIRAALVAFTESTTVRDVTISHCNFGVGENVKLEESTENQI